MDIVLNKVQKDIAKEARRFLKKECTMEYVRDMLEDDRGYQDDLWSKMADMGWMSIRIPEEFGGMGMGQADINVVLEEMGRALIPGPFFSTVVLAAEIIMECGDEGQKKKYLPGIADGRTTGTLAIYEPDSGADPNFIKMKAQQKDDGYVLNGTKLFVPDAHTADFIVCAACTKDDAITLFLLDPHAEGMNISNLPVMDGTRRLGAVEINNLSVGRECVLGEPDKGRNPLQKVLQRAQTGLCAEIIGGAERSMEIAVWHAKNRVQFDQPIGAYQSIKHRCAQMFLEIESSRSLLYWAGWAQDHAEPQEAAIAASTVKSYCSETGKNVTSSAIQVLGANGFSWESDLHLYFKRARANEVALGDTVFHREQIVQLITNNPA